MRDKDDFVKKYLEDAELTEARVQFNLAMFKALQASSDLEIEVARDLISKARALALAGSKFEKEFHRPDVQ